jgi:putative endonuclease
VRSGWKSSGERRLFFPYIMSNASMTLYVGVTNNLIDRVQQHKRGKGGVFTSRYHFDRLVWFESTPDVVAAITREKQLKGMTRKKKIALVKLTNPNWVDLTADWLF